MLITICTHQRRPLFGVVIKEATSARVELSMIGDIVRQEWTASSDASHAMVVMPNHVHGIVQVGGRSIAEFVRGLKSAVTSRVKHELDDEVCRVWQRTYHDRILRDGEVVGARKYIGTNPITWLL